MSYDPVEKFAAEFRKMRNCAFDCVGAGAGCLCCIDSLSLISTLRLNLQSAGMIDAGQGPVPISSELGTDEAREAAADIRRAMIDELVRVGPKK